MRRYLYRIIKAFTTAALVLALAGTMFISVSEPVMAVSKLKVTPKSKVIYIGDTVKLKSNLKVKWTISSGSKKIKLTQKKNKSVTVKALKTGVAYVKAKKGKTSKKIKITVRSRVPSKITIKVNKNNILKGGFSVASVKSVSPSYASKDVKWSSSNKEIATIDKKGFITGISPGKVKITAKSKLNNKIKGSVTIYVADVKRGTITAKVDLSDAEKYPSGKVTRLWIPLPSDDDWQIVKEIKYDAPDASIEETTDSTGRNRALYIEWGSDVAPEKRIANLSFHIERHGVIRPDDLAALEKGSVDKEKYADFLKETTWSGTLSSGIIKKTADDIIKSAGAETVYDKAYAIYDWVLENLTRDASTPGLGKGDVVYILNHLDGGIGKCTDVNSVFGSLCQAEGIPARGIFGMKFDTCGQKCKPQFLLPGYGWTDADPSEVLKQIMGHEDEFRGKDAAFAEKWSELKDQYWGGTDAGWFMFSDGRDITLSPAQSATSADSENFLNPDGTLNYFAFPYAEYDGKYLTCWGKNKEFVYTYQFEEDPDCNC